MKLRTSFEGHKIQNTWAPYHFTHWDHCTGRNAFKPVWKDSEGKELQGEVKLCWRINCFALVGPLQTLGISMKSFCENCRNERHQCDGRYAIMAGFIEFSNCVGRMNPGTTPTWAYV